MSKKSKKTGTAKASRKRSPVKDLSAKNARSVKGGSVNADSRTAFNYSKVEMEYK
jgi:hypothetical protein